MECGQSFVGQWKSLFINKEGQANSVRKCGWSIIPWAMTNCFYQQGACVSLC